MSSSANTFIFKEICLMVGLGTLGHEDVQPPPPPPPPTQLRQGHQAKEKGSSKVTPTGPPC
eukprot:5295493-Karenia_brevis.AAC.1